MNNNFRIKKILSIIIALFIGDFLFIIISHLFKSQFHALIPNSNILSLVCQVITAMLATVCVLMFRKTKIYMLNGKALKEGFFPNIILFIFSPFTYLLLIFPSKIFYILLPFISSS